MKNWTHWIAPFIFAVLVIAVYKTFDNFNMITIWIGRLFSLLKPFFIGGVIAYLLYPPCNMLEKKMEKTKAKWIAKHARGISIAAVYLVAVLVIFLILRLVVPMMYESVADLVKNLPNYYRDIVSYINGLDFITGDVEVFLNDSVDGFVNSISVDSILRLIDLQNVTKYAQGVAVVSSGIITLFMGFAISVYILIDRDSLGDLVSKIIKLYVKPKFAKPIIKYTKKINEFLYKYLYCQFLDACIVSVASFIGLSLIKVPYALIFALLIGALNMVPYFGSIISAVITIIFTIFTGGITKAIWTAVFLIFLQQIDANITQPKLVSANLNVRPFWIIMGIVIGGGYFGLIGIVLAAPIVAVVKIIVNDILEMKEKRLNEPETIRGGQNESIKN